MQAVHDFLNRSGVVPPVRDDHLVTVSPSRHPFANPGLGLLILIVASRVDEVATSFNEGVEQFKRGFLVHASHEAGPGIADGHGSELEGGNADAGRRREDTVSGELTLRLWCGFPDVGHDRD
ncbi:hypothetical protein V496_05114 [Pseudogymnoascus sp. VKM F-4515 (FW-2607)]|nr:hypothetical protein V496_05114 [Pseudogymnoascus sp. VKM F-4515 (FW-2607)]